MFKSRSLTRSATALAGAAITLVLGTGPAYGATSCKQVHGRLVDQEQFAGPSCAGSFFCVRGRATGSLRGDFVSTVTSITPSQDAAVTGVAFFTADLVLNDRAGRADDQGGDRIQHGRQWRVRGPRDGRCRIFATGKVLRAG